jgi:hypothetical protein
MTNDELLTQYNEAHELATELFDGIWEDSVMWMQTPTELFFGKAPGQLIASGDGHLVIEWLMVRTGKKPGAAF